MEQAQTAYLRVLFTSVDLSCMSVTPDVTAAEEGHPTQARECCLETMYGEAKLLLLRHDSQLVRVLFPGPSLHVRHVRAGLTSQLLLSSNAQARQCHPRHVGCQPCLLNQMPLLRILVSCFWCEVQQAECCAQKQHVKAMQDFSCH